MGKGLRIPIPCNDMVVLTDAERGSGRWPPSGAFEKLFRSG